MIAPRRLAGSQRAALGVAISLPVLLALGVTLVVGIYVLSPRTFPSLPAPEVTVNLGIPVNEIGVGDAIHIVAPSGTAFLKLDGGGFNRAGQTAPAGWFVRSAGGLFALAATSSHLGCSVDFDPSAHQFEDPCGGSRYAIDGSVVHGPGAFPLSHLGWRLVGASEIAIQVVYTGSMR